MTSNMPVFTLGRNAVAMPVDEFYVDGDVLDILDVCDELAIGLGRLHRKGRIRGEDWTRATQRLGEIRAIIETGRRH